MKLCEELRQVINEFLRANKKPVSFLVKNSGVSRNTVDRILNNQLKGDPGRETTRKIAIFVSKKKKLKEVSQFFDEKNYLKIGESVLEGIPEQDVSDDLYYPNSAIEPLLFDWSTFVIFTLSAHLKDGATKEDFKEICGNLYEDALDELVSREVIYLSNGRYINPNPDFQVPREAIIRHLPKILKVNTCHSKFIDWKINFWFCWGFTEKVARESAEELNACVNNILRKKLDKENWGDTPFNMVISVNTFDAAEKKREV